MENKLRNIESFSKELRDLEREKEELKKLAGALKREPSPTITIDYIDIVGDERDLRCYSFQSEKAVLEIVEEFVEKRIKEKRETQARKVQRLKDILNEE